MWPHLYICFLFVFFEALELAVELFNGVGLLLIKLNKHFGLLQNLLVFITEIGGNDIALCVGISSFYCLDFNGLFL
jgi:hypothetical protein